jgi:hypothetical protein
MRIRYEVEFIVEVGAHRNATHCDDVLCSGTDCLLGYGIVN